MPGVIENTRRLKICQGEYDFAVDGGAISTITLRSAVDDPSGNQMPINAIIEGGYIEVDTILASAGAPTVAAQAEAAGDLQAAAAFNAAPWSTTGRKSITPAFTGATVIKTTVARSLAIVIAAATLTAGKFRVVVWYR